MTEPEKQILDDGTIEYSLNGRLHREDGPAIICPSGYKSWCRNGRSHREDGPAYEGPDGLKKWYKEGYLHRQDGPAVICPTSGYKGWWRNGELHREDGPAVEFDDGQKEWWINGEEVDVYHPNFGCAADEIKTREQAIERLNRKPRPYSYDLYMEDIDRLFPEGDRIDYSQKEIEMTKEKIENIMPDAAKCENLIESINCNYPDVHPLARLGVLKALREVLADHINELESYID